MERKFSADPELVFAFLSRPEHLIRWWGHEGFTITEHRLDFSQPGAWVSVFMNADGGRHKVSGEVTAVDPPRLVEFPWAWHDEKDARGHDSSVRFEVIPGGEGETRFILTHSGLADEESVANHKLGWTSTFKKLESIAH